MKLLRLPLLPVMLLMAFYAQVHAVVPTSGFFLPDSLQEMTLKFRSMKNLIVIPVMINNSIEVNLILDTGCRNLILFGRKFSQLLQVDPKKQVQFSGLGSGDPVHGYLSLDNTVSIKSIMGTNIPIVVVSSKNIFSKHVGIDGVIGYDIFLKFEIEINPRTKRLTFRPAASAMAPTGYSQIPLKIIDSRPILSSIIHFTKKNNQPVDLMIDTGSALGLLLKTTDISKFTYNQSEKIIGEGLNGALFGISTKADKILLPGFEIQSLPIGITRSEWHNYASIGMDILKDYVLILNYCKAYACLKKIEG